MSLEIIVENTVTYNTELYEKYNRYLILQHEILLKFFENQINLYNTYPNLNKDKTIKGVKKLINDLNDLLTDNIPEPGMSLPITKIFNVMDWELQLRQSYDLISKCQKELNDKNFIIENTISIDKFFRKLKLSKLSKLSKL